MGKPGAAMGELTRNIRNCTRLPTVTISLCHGHPRGSTWQALLELVLSLYLPVPSLPPHCPQEEACQLAPTPNSTLSVTPKDSQQTGYRERPAKLLKFSNLSFHI